jgi:cytoskeletal protein CcmA (bactofilin family)
MSLWKEPTPKDSSGEAKKPESAIRPVEPPPPPVYPRVEVPRAAAMSQPSNIQQGITIEGRIEGKGDLKIAGQFQGDVRIQGQVTVEATASVTGEIHGDSIVIEGTVKGNVSARGEIRLVRSAYIEGDLKARSVTIEAGARMRGQAEFGWEERPEPSRAAETLPKPHGNGPSL